MSAEKAGLAPNPESVPESADVSSILKRKHSGKRKARPAGLHPRGRRFRWAAEVKVFFPLPTWS